MITNLLQRLKQGSRKLHIERVGIKFTLKMAEQELRDRSGKLLGKIRDLGAGKLEIRNASGSLKGTYDPRSNETRNASGSLIGKGNLLSSLL